MDIGTFQLVVPINKGADFRELSEQSVGRGRVDSPGLTERRPLIPGGSQPCDLTQNEFDTVSIKE